ncbi:MAG: hypothetical protein JSW26_02350 [Desulfobacterales bacterium]|nr:MAG: hypothetical protein JSW26_02350 [Desulfobacterales bacterium]
MKKIILLTLIVCWLLSVSGWSRADDFLGAPVIPGGEPISKTKKRLELNSKKTHDEVLRFYKEALAQLNDIKYRNWKDATYIEDDGGLKWHSITISKDDANGAVVVIVKDNWTWIIGTLILRYIGVFVVLLFLLIGMSISGAIISRSVKKLEEKETAAKA